VRKQANLSLRGICQFIQASPPLPPCPEIGWIVDVLGNRRPCDVAEAHPVNLHVLLHGASSEATNAAWRCCACGTLAVRLTGGFDWLPLKHCPVRTAGPSTRHAFKADSRPPGPIKFAGTMCHKENGGHDNGACSWASSHHQLRPGRVVG